MQLPPWPAALLCPLLVLAAPSSSDEAPHAPFPDGFLKWTRLKATTLDPKDPATAKLRDAHFVYANDLAVEGLRTGQYKEGAVFVLDILKISRKDGVATLGERDSTSTMVRDARFAATGGWDFEDYDIVTRQPLKMDAAAACYECHTKKEDQGFVFTRLK